MVEGQVKEWGWIQWVVTKEEGSPQQGCLVRCVSYDRDDEGKGGEPGYLCQAVPSARPSVAVGLAQTQLELQLSQSQSSMIDWISFLSQVGGLSSQPA